MKVFIASFFCILSLQLSAQKVKPFKDPGSGRYGFKDESGKTVIEPKYDELYSFSSGAFSFKTGKKQGFVDGMGQELWSSTRYEYVGNLIHGMSLVSKNHKYGYIDKMGKEVVPLKYDMAEPFNEEGYGKVKSKEQYFLLDSLGNLAKGNAGFNISAKVTVAKERWVVVLSKNLEAKEPVYFLTANKYGKFPAPFGASITWQIVDSKNNVIKEERVAAGESFAFRVPADGLYTVQAYYDMKACTGCRSEDKPAAFTMEYSFNTKL